MKWSARDAVADLQLRIEDTGANNFTAVQLLSILDQTVSRIYEMARRKLPDYELSELTLTPGTDLTQDSTDTKAYYYELPERVVEVRYVEGQWAPGRMQKIDNARKPIRYRGGRHAWGWQGGRPGRLYIYGDPTQFTSLRIYYKRSWAPLHYGTTDSTASSDTNFRFAAAPTGQFVNRAGLYDDMDIIIEEAAHADLYQTRRITTYTGGTNREMTVNAAFSGAIAIGTDYSLVVPLDWGHRFYVLDEAEDVCFRSIGEFRPNAGLLRAREDFLASVRHRAGPTYVYRS